MVFKLGGKGQLPDVVSRPEYPTPPPRTGLGEAGLDRGWVLYNRFCGRCHGANAVSDGTVPDLRHLPPIWHDNFAEVVLNGMMESAGMPRFDDALSKNDVDNIHAYLIERAHEDQQLRESASWWITLLTWLHTLFAKLLGWIVSLA